MDYVIETKMLPKVNELVGKGYRIYSALRAEKYDKPLLIGCEDVLYVMVKYPEEKKDEVLK